VLQSRPVRVRSAAGDDLPTLHRALVHAFNWEPTRDPLPLDHPALAAYRDHWGRPGDLGVIADVDGEPVGAAFCRLVRGYGFVDERTPEVTIGVDAAFRGCGIGCALLLALAELAKAEGFHQLSLSVEPTNPAVRLYKRIGYRPVDIDEGGSVTMIRAL
jgi:ribosomal protein S18 acetylase RimI-like enzyme